MKSLIATTSILLFSQVALSQNVGISEAAPDSKLDVVQTETTGNSIEVSHNVTTNNSSALWIKNSGLGRSMNVQTLNTGNTMPIAQFVQLGTGIGLQIDMNASSPNTSIGTYLGMPGLGLGHFVSMSNAANANPGIYIDHAGSGNGITNFQTGTGLGIYNDAANGNALFNVIQSNAVGTIDLLTSAGGIGNYIDLDVQDGVGVNVIGVNNVTTPTAGGDIYAYMGLVRTATPTVGTTVNGAVLGGEQHGNGHGIILNHYGNTGRNAEFDVNGVNNTEPAIFSVHNGQGSVIVGQNQNNAITGLINVADFSYTGTDIADHVGVNGQSTPAAGWGIGVVGTGNFYGVFSQGNFGATGTKTFLIDHPSDPENKMLRHFSVESNEVLNMYRGMVELDANGEAVVQLPDYFQDINVNFSYQLTPVGSPQQPYVMTEIQGNTFQVGGAPNSKVSWVVYADRNDLYLQQNPQMTTDVVDKTGERAGKYIQPELYGQPASNAMFKGCTPVNNAQQNYMNNIPQSVQDGIDQQASGQTPANITPTGQNEN